MALKARRVLAALLTAALLAGCAAEDNSSSPAPKETEVSSRTVTSAPTVTLPVQTEPPEDTEAVDREKIAEAYKTGDRSALNSFEADALDAALQLIESCTEEDMTVPEKELAIHDKFALSCRYDDEELNVFHSHSPHSSDPYGALVEGKAVCQGYAETYALLMDLIGVECRVVHGTNRKGNEHAWNLVCYEDSWYCVDMTWDDLDGNDSTGEIKHEFFNVPDTVFYEHDHRWDTSAYPRALGTKYSYSSLFADTLTTEEQLISLVTERAEKGDRDISVISHSQLEKKLMTAADISTVNYKTLRRLFESAGLKIRLVRADKTYRGNALYISFLKMI